MMNHTVPDNSMPKDRTQFCMPHPSRRPLAAILVFAVLLGTLAFALHWNNARKPDPFPGSLSEFLHGCRLTPSFYYQGQIYLLAIDMTPQDDLSNDWKFAGKLNASLPWEDPLTADFQTHYEELVGCVLWENALTPNQLYLQAGEEYCQFVVRPLLLSEMYYGDCSTRGDG